METLDVRISSQVKSGAATAAAVVWWWSRGRLFEKLRVQLFECANRAQRLDASARAVHAALQWNAGAPGAEARAVVDELAADPLQVVAHLRELLTKLRREHRVFQHTAAVESGV